MMNFIAKSLVLLHTVLSVGAMTWAVATVLQWKDFGWMEPNKEVLEYTKEGEPKLSVRHASTYDKSVAALTEAGRTRDRTYVFVKPAIESIQTTEKYLPQNYLFFVNELKKLRESPDKIDVLRLQDGGLAVEPNTGNLGKPVFEAKPLDNVTKSHKVYLDDLKMIYGKIDKVEEEIQAIVIKTKAITGELTETKFNTEERPGLYKLTDLEFKFQTEIKNEIADIKPNWSKSIEQSLLYQYRRADLEATLQKLKGALPAPK